MSSHDVSYKLAYTDSKLMQHSIVMGSERLSPGNAKES
jgi:hypothetical protein